MDDGRKYRFCLLSSPTVANHYRTCVLHLRNSSRTNIERKILLQHGQWRKLEKYSPNEKIISFNIFFTDSTEVHSLITILLYLGIQMNYSNQITLFEFDGLQVRTANYFPTANKRKRHDIFFPNLSAHYRIPNVANLEVISIIFSNAFF